MSRGLNRLEALVELLDRELNLANSTIKDATIKDATIKDATIKDAALTGFTKVTATGDITAAMSGRDILVGPAAAGLASDATLTLPTAADGLRYRFVYVGGAADAQDFQINTGSNTNFFIGGLTFLDTTDDTENEPVAVFGNNSSNSRVNILTPVPGTVVECYCDGTNWFLHGVVVSASTPTFADQ